MTSTVFNPPTVRMLFTQGVASNPEAVSVFEASTDKLNNVKPGISLLIKALDDYAVNLDVVDERIDAIMKEHGIN